MVAQVLPHVLLVVLGTWNCVNFSFFCATCFWCPLCQPLALSSCMPTPCCLPLRRVLAKYCLFRPQPVGPTHTAYHRHQKDCLVHDTWRQRNDGHGHTCMAACTVQGSCLVLWDPHHSGWQGNAPPVPQAQVFQCDCLVHQESMDHQ